MSVCTFFGHRECYGLDQGRLNQKIEELIAEGVDTFYVGNQGQFDAYVRSALRQFKKRYPHIRYAVVLAYLPGEKQEYVDFSDTMCPEGVAEGHPKFAITRRNRWMLKEADWVICYVCHSWGGAYRFWKQAKKAGKRIINLGDCAVDLL